MAFAYFPTCEHPESALPILIIYGGLAIVSSMLSLYLEYNLFRVVIPSCNCHSLVTCVLR